MTRGLRDGAHYSPTRDAHLFDPYTVFLSASVVQASREGETTQPPGEAESVREAIVHVVRQVLLNRWNVVFGGHPQVTPMLLVLAKELQETPHGNILCFQSDHFVGRIPAATRELWKYGAVLMTPAKPGRDEAETVALSLQAMRAAMLGVPKLRAGIFVGGMKGVLDEAEMLRSKRIPNVSLYALPGTGSAAAQLFLQDPATYSGDSSELALLMRRSRGQAIVARRIVEHIERAIQRRP